jgi:integrase
MHHNITVHEACELFLSQHEASPARLAVLEHMLRRACHTLGPRPLTQLAPEEVARWRAGMTPPMRWQATQALKQVSAWARRWELTNRDALAHVRNPRPWQPEVQPFASWAAVEAVAAALPASLQLLPILGAGCGLRPGELLGLDWASIDLSQRLVLVRASCVDGTLRQTLKTAGSRRNVPLRDRVVRAIVHAGGPGTGLVFAGRDGGARDLRNLRRRAWRPALATAGTAHQHRIYDLRHTYATWSLRAGVSTYQLARRMGTSIAMIDATYGHLAADAAEHERALLDAWDGGL